MDQAISFSLEQEIKQMLLSVKPVKLRNGIAEVQQLTHIIKDIWGLVRLAAAPYYSLILDTGTDELPFILPLTLVDSARYICHWIALVGKRVLIKKLLIVSEQFVIFGKTKDLHVISIIVKWDDIKIMNQSQLLQKQPSSDLDELNCLIRNDEEIKIMYQSQLPQKQPSSPLDELNCLIKNDEERDGYCHIFVHHVSTPFLVNKTFVCLVFISYLNCSSIETKLWLILQGGQVAWREFLVPSREYFIKFPDNVDKYYFDKSHKPLKMIISPYPRELQVIFHHKEIFTNLNGCKLPFESKILLSSNENFSSYIYRFVKDPLSMWYSADEAEHANVDLITLYGEVDSVIYDEEIVYKSCYLCIQAKPRKPELAEPAQTTLHPWMNPWLSPLSIENDELLELPCSKETITNTSTGVPGNMVQIFKLKDVVTGREKSIYMKHSFTPNSLQIFRVTAGMVLCISHLNRRCSNTGKYYFITTVLSSFKVLSYSNNKHTRTEAWGLYGLQQLIPESRDKMWGVLESFNLSKVAITTKCTNCNALFTNRQCSKLCSSPKMCFISAHAIAWIQIIHDKKIVSLEKVIIKNKNVQTLLCIPEKIWQGFLEAAEGGEIICFTNDHNVNSIHSMGLSGLFKMYCDMARPKIKFYICVKKISSDEGPLYYCIILEPINTYRLGAVAEYVEKMLK